jgi:AcrR family transcriptional regulator
MNEKTTERKQIKKDRTKRYFLDAAKEIIRTEGVACLTTKKIGEKAAYSYASIYNYFANFNELVCQCLEELAAESAERVAAHIEGDTPRDRIMSLARLMVEENARKPNLYSPFLSTEIDYSYFLSRDGHPFVHPAYTLLLGEIRLIPALPGGETGARVLADILTCIFHSKLHFFIRYGTPPNLDRLESELDEECRFILDRTIGEN